MVMSNPEVTATGGTSGTWDTDRPLQRGARHSAAKRLLLFAGHWRHRHPASPDRLSWLPVSGRCGAILGTVWTIRTADTHRLEALTTRRAYHHQSHGSAATRLQL